MSDELERLRRWVSAVVPTDWQASEAGKLLDAALSSARAEALEEAARIFDRMRAEDSEPIWPEFAACEVRALITTPAPVSIPVERVREMFREALEYNWLRPAQATALARILGVDLDGAVEGRPVTALCNRHPLCMQDKGHPGTCGDLGGELP
jgi:hypothetical protein